MPEQTSSRGQPITQAEFTAPFDTILLPFTPARLNIQDDLLALPAGSFPRLTNLVARQDGRLTPREGQQGLATAGTEHHSVRKLRDPQLAIDTRFWGIDTQLYRGASGVLTSIDLGYSGDPLTLVPHRPPISGDPWMFVADRARMRKVLYDGTMAQIGLPAPTVAATTALETERRTNVANFRPDDGTNGATWTNNAGQYFGLATPLATGVPFTADHADSVAFVTTPITPPAGTTGYDSWWGRALVANLNLVGGVEAEDDDLMHVRLLASHPHLIAEIRIYFVLSDGGGFSDTILPGTSPAVNVDFYVKAFTQDDFAPFLQREETHFEAGRRAQERRGREEAILTGRQAVRRGQNPGAQATISQTTSPGSSWYETAVIGVPLRRGDFRRVGNAPGRDWGTVTGVFIYLRTAYTAPPSQGATTSVYVNVADLYLTGGYGPDTSEPGAQPYDYRYTHYDTRTGAEGNPSPTMDEANYQDALRRGIVITPTAYAGLGTGFVHQRFYRRGGSLIDDWYFVGENLTDGGVFQDHETDDGIVAAGTVAIDHFQPVPTVDDAGNTVLNQAVPALWGPLEGMLFACGDPYRPGHLYYCLPDQPDHWSASGNKEVCAPSEELMHGGVIGSHGFVFSRRTLYLIYPGLTSSGSVSTTPTQVKRGLWARWAFVVGPGGIYFMAEDGIFVTTGGPEQWISREIDPLFRGEQKHGYWPIDKAAKTPLRMTIHEHKLYFQYQDVLGARQCWVYDLLTQASWHYQFGRAHSVLQGEDEDTLLIGGFNQGRTYTHEGTSDDGIPIAWYVRSAPLSGNRREEKLLGDQTVLCDRDGITLTLQNFLNEETVTNPPQLIAEGTGRLSYILDSFGEVPQRARSISTEIRGSSATQRPYLVSLGTAITIQPEITSDRVTNWDDLGHPDEKWVTGITFDVDTFGQDRTIIIERDFNNERTTIDTLTVNTNTRHKVTFSWAAVPAQQVRVRPSDECKFWVLYRADWIALPEPPRISKWDIHFENAWDQYYTGLDLYCDTLGLEKRIEVYVDESIVTNPFTGLDYFPVVANGRRVVHLTFTAGRGHVLRFRAIDDNPGLLYTHRWHLQEEPSEQANWNQNFTVFGSRADKWLKAVVFECDTFGQNKSVRIEVDNTTVETLTVNANGRLVRQIALTIQQLGRVWRMYPADGNPGRLYSVQPVFDEEPFCLDRWETQESNFGIPGWFYLTTGHVTLKASRNVTLSVVMMVNQKGKTITEQYTIGQTSGRKVKRFVSFKAHKGVLVKFILTSESPFWLYEEETNLEIVPWGGRPFLIRPFGNEGADPTRNMTVSALAAARSGGSA